METNNTKESLIKALRETQCPNLPEELKDGELWAMAIVKVLKANYSDEYVIAKHIFENGEDKMNVVNDCGTMNPIVKTLSIHPYQIVQFIPEFKNKKEIITYLCNATHSEESAFEGFNKERLTNAVKKVLLHNFFKNNK